MIIANKISKLFITSILLAVAAMAQSGSSTLAGTLKDPAGAVIPGAKVHVINEESGVRQDTVTNETGIFRVGSLLPGAYRLEVDPDGFQKLVRGSVVLEVGRVVALDLTAQLPTSTETLTVIESAPMVESQSSNVAQAVNRQMLAGLPLPNRAASSLAALAPGVVMIDSGTGTAENYPVFSVAGGRARNQNFTLDGGNVSNAVGLTRPQQLTSLPVDAMQEFRVIANNYSAEYGHSTGGVITMSTRSGTNQYHGSLFESLQNNVFNARNFFAATRPPIRLNQYGGILRRPHPQGQDLLLRHLGAHRPVDQRSPPPPPCRPLLNRAGDFSDLRSSAGKPVLIYDPADHRRHHAPALRRQS